ncbi:cytochrome p450 [Plakobranchus ocellatus]|uniref:Cytochrome p450 n=1 Tax=Plakobranchus ocellatus TaxID=259542 RepID=A0AAV4C4X8_9GAST|nr:cytochrome p450 [Plakobranchus ocellatus]
MSLLASYILGAALVAVVAFVSFHLAIVFSDYRRRRNMLVKFPHNKPHFIFGNLFEYPGPNDEGMAFQREMTGKFPQVNLVWMMNIPMLIVNHPNTVSVILKSSEPKGPRTYNLIRPWIGDGLLTSKGDKWYRNRRLLTPSFHFEILKSYIQLKNRCADILVNKFLHAAETSSSLLVFSEVAMFTLDVILKCAMSYETNCQLPGEPWFHNDFIFSLTPSGRKFSKNCDYVHQIAETIIKERQQELHKEMGATDKKHKSLDFLDILLTARDENGEGLTMREIRDEVDTFLFEGHDTTASAISWTLYSLAEHPDVQRRVQEELDSVLDHSSHTDVMWDDLPNLTYLTMVIKEAMRLHSPVPFIQRILTEDMEIDGKMAPAGTLINIVIYNIHHNPVVWTDSMKFDPDRFLPENVESRSPYAFVPFSAGPRNCIGQNFAMHEIKIALARILHKGKGNRWTKNAQNGNQGQEEETWADQKQDGWMTEWQRKVKDWRKWETCTEGYILQWMDKASK